MDREDVVDINKIYRRLEEAARKAYSDLTNEGYPRVYVRVEVRVGTYNIFSKVSEFGSLEETPADVLRDRLDSFFRRLHRDIVEKVEFYLDKKYGEVEE